MLRIAIRMGLVVLAAYLARQWSLASGGPGAFLSLLVDLGSTPWFGLAIYLAFALLLCFAGAFRSGFWLLLLGMLGGLMLAPLEPTGAWQGFVPVPPYQALAAVFLLAIAHVLLWSSPRATFRSGKLQLRDGGDHLSVQRGDDGVTVFPHGRVLCGQRSETRSETRYGGGTYSVPTTSTVVTYGPNGTNYGTVFGSQTVSSPMFSYEVWKSTGNTTYQLEEVGQDQALLVAPRPKHVGLVARHVASHRGKSASFTLGPWAAFRFDMWRRFHARAFFRKDPAAARKIAKAARAHFTEMKKRYGRTSAHELHLDHEMALVSFVGASRDKAFVHLAHPPTTLTFGKHEADAYWQRGRLRIPGDEHGIGVGGKLATRLSEWAQLAAMREGKRR